MRNKNQALFTILLLAVAAVVVMPFVIGGTGMMTSVGMYPGMMGGYVGVGWGMLAGGLMMVALWALAIAGAVLLVRRLTEPEPSAADVLRQRYAAGDITREQYEQMLAVLG
jgi:putative membrane protein